VRLASEVLPVVSVHTLFPAMLFVTGRTPDGLEVEHIEVSIPLHLVYQVHRQFFLVVGEGTHVAIVAGIEPVWVLLTEFGFVLLRVVEVLHSVVGSGAATFVFTLV